MTAPVVTVRGPYATTTPPPTRKEASMADPAFPSSNEEAPRVPNAVARMVGLERAGELLGRGGQKVIADALGIDPRALRYKNAGDATISNGDLRSAATALEEVAGRLIDHAHKLREEARAGSPVRHEMAMQRVDF